MSNTKSSEVYKALKKVITFAVILVGVFLFTSTFGVAKEEELFSPAPPTDNTKLSPSSKLNSKDFKQSLEVICRRLNERPINGKKAPGDNTPPAFNSRNARISNQKFVIGSKGQFDSNDYKRILTRIGTDKEDVSGKSYIVLKKTNGTWRAQCPIDRDLLTKTVEIEKFAEIKNTKISIHLLGPAPSTNLFEDRSNKFYEYPHLLTAYVDENNDIQYRALYAEIHDNQSIDIFMTQDLFRAVPSRTLGSLLQKFISEIRSVKIFEMEYNAAPPLYLSGILPFIQNDLERWKSIVYHALQLADGVRYEFKEKGYINIKPLFEMGSSGRGYNVKYLTAFDKNNNREVVIKIDEYASDLFKIFGRHNAADTGFMAVFDGGRLSDGGEYAILEYIRGEPLEDVIAREEVFSLDEILNIMTQLMKGVERFHNNGFVHGDICPNNIHITEDKRIGVVDPLYQDPEEYDETGRCEDFDKHAMEDLSSIGDNIMMILTGKRISDYPIKCGENGPVTMTPAEIKSLILERHPNISKIDEDTLDALVIIFHKLANGVFVSTEEYRKNSPREYLTEIEYNYYHNAGEVLAEMSNLIARMETARDSLSSRLKPVKNGLNQFYATEDKISISL